MEDLKVKKILSYIEQGGGYSIEGLSTFKKLYPIIIDYFHKCNARSQFKSDVVQILSLSKLDDMYIAEAKFVNRTNKKSSKRRISLMLNDTKILALIKDYEYMLKRNLRYVNDLYKELKKRNISPIDFSINKAEDYIDDLFSFLKDKLPKIDDFDSDFETMSKIYSSEDTSNLQEEDKRKAVSQMSNEVRMSNNVPKDIEEDMNSSFYKKVTFSPRNEIIDIPVDSTNRPDNTTKFKKKKILEKDIFGKSEFKCTNSNFVSSSPFNEVFITKKKLNSGKNVLISPDLKITEEKRNNVIIDTSKVLNRADMSNYLDIIDGNDLAISVDQLYNMPNKDPDDDFETMVNSSELLKNLKDDDDMIEEQKKIKEVEKVKGIIIKPEETENVDKLDKSYATCEQLRSKSFDPSLKECNTVKTNILLDVKDINNLVEEKFINEQIPVKSFEGSSLASSSSNAKPREEKSFERLNPNLFNTNAMFDKKNSNLFEDIFNESKISKETGQNLNNLETEDKKISGTKKSNQISENVVNEAHQKIKEEDNKKAARKEVFKDKDVLQINKKKEDKKIDVSFLLSKIRYKRT